MTYILGISAFFHDSSATILCDGNIVAAAQEERFTRVKQDRSFPVNAIKYLCDKIGVKLSEIDHIIFYEKPFLKFDRLLETYLSYAPKGWRSYLKAMPLWLKEKLFQKKIIFDELKKIDNSYNNIEKIFFSDHHSSHAASAFFPSPFLESAILTLDGVGEWATSTIALGKFNKIEIKEEINFPHSLGLLYSAFTYYCGFQVNEGEYKLMGLAPYGKPIYEDLITKYLIDIKDDGSYNLNMRYFDYASGLTMTNSKFDRLFMNKPRKKDDKITNFYMDIASSIQKVAEDVVLKICRYIKKKYNTENLCLAGGVALNCVVNGKIIDEKIFKNVWIQPAAGDAGGSLGASLLLWYDYLNNKREINIDKDFMKGSFLGPSYSNDEIKSYLKKSNLDFEYFSDELLFTKVSRLISDGNIIGWFQGRMEFGPRALGARSILGDPRNSEMQKKMNLKIKFRESFRPFAPCILEDDLENWFNTSEKNEYMLVVSSIIEKRRIKPNWSLNGLKKLNFAYSDIPAVTHVDYSARVQTVSKKNIRLYNLLKAFKELTNCPVLINTSFNLNGEPIVMTPEDACKCFLKTNIDYLVLENFLVKKVM